VKGYNLSGDVYSYLFCNHPDHTVERQEEDKNSVCVLI